MKVRKTRQEATTKNIGGPVYFFAINCNGRRMRFTEHITDKGEMRNTHRILMRKPSCKCKDNIVMECKEIRCDNAD